MAIKTMGSERENGELLSIKLRSKCSASRKSCSIRAFWSGVLANFKIRFIAFGIEFRGRDFKIRSFNAPSFFLFGVVFRIKLERRGLYVCVCFPRFRIVHTRYKVTVICRFAARFLTKYQRVFLQFCTVRAVALRSVRTFLKRELCKNPKLAVIVKVHAPVDREITKRGGKRKKKKK